ncbi:MAG TPA: MAPEG family protein [Allosphingosinicella sp.]|nr:MAPEG family protein [Allosphingosinicella sp.]
MILPISLTIAAAAALLHVWLSMRVSRLRRLHRISIGDEGNKAVATRMRAHGNFAENTPVFLILLALTEHAIGSELWLWIVAAVYIVARLLHAFGMDRPAPNWMRIGGVGLSWLVLLGLAGHALFLSYGDQSHRRAIEAPQPHRASR